MSEKRIMITSKFSRWYRAYDMARRVSRGQTLKSVGIIYGVSQERVRQICGRVIRRAERNGCDVALNDTTTRWLRHNKHVVEREYRDFLTNPLI